MNGRREWLAMGAALLALSTLACGRIPATHYYVLGLHPPQVVAASVAAGDAAKNGLVVGVASFHVDPPYDQDRLVYRVGRDSPEVAFYHYHRWAAPLSRLLPGAVAEAFRGVPGLRSIEPRSPGQDYAARLDGRLHLLEEVDLPDGQRLRFRLTLALRLEDGTVVWTGELVENRAIEVDGVPDVAAAISVTLVEALHAARNDLERALAAADGR